MSYNSNFRKWTNLLLDQFSSLNLQKQMRSTGDSFNGASSYYQRFDSDQSYKEMPSIYKRYAQSLQAKRNAYQSNDVLFDNMSKMNFVQFKHYPHRDTCAQECTLKKKSKRNMCRCKENCNRTEVKCCCTHHKVVQQQPIVVKEIHTVVVPAPPTIIREMPRPVPIVRQMQVIRQAPIMRPVSAMSSINSQVRRQVVQSRSPSHSKITINYISPPKPQMIQSILLPAQPSRVLCSSSSPYKLLESSRKQEEVPRIVITEPAQLKKNLAESYFSFQNEERKSRRQSKERKRIFPSKEAETAKFIPVTPISNRTNMSESFKIYQHDNSFTQSAMMYHKFSADPIRE